MEMRSQTKGGRDEPVENRRPTGTPGAMNRRVKQIGSLILAGMGTWMLMGQAVPGGQEGEAKQVILAEAGGTPRATLRLVNGSHAQHPFQSYYLSYQRARVAIPTHYAPMTFADFLALPGLPEEYRQSDWTTVRESTQRGVSLEGYIAELVPSKDGDLHVHLRETKQPRCFPDGSRRDQLVAEVTRAFQPPKTGWSYDALLDLCERQARVRFSGWLLHDFEHVQDVGDWRGSEWEIHPVTKIEVWDSERHSWSPLR